MVFHIMSEDWKATDNDTISKRDGLTFQPVQGADIVLRFGLMTTSARAAPFCPTKIFRLLLPLHSAIFFY